MAERKRAAVSSNPPSTSASAALLHGGVGEVTIIPFDLYASAERELNTPWAPTDAETLGVDESSYKRAMQCALNARTGFDRFRELRNAQTSASTALRNLPAPTTPPTEAVEKQRKELTKQLTQLEVDLKEFD